jgi:hypothetical protein
MDVHPKRTPQTSTQYMGANAFTTLPSVVLLL